MSHSRRDICLIGTALMLMSAIASCQATSRNDAGLEPASDAGPDAGLDAGPTEIGSALELVASAPPLYSIAFDEQGAFGLTVLPATVPAASCDSFFAVAGDGWLLELWTPLAPGTYAVGPSTSDSYPPSSGQAVVVLRHNARDSFPETVEVLPTEGQVVVTAAPADPAAQVAGTHLTGSYHIGFPSDPLQPPSECFGGGQALPDGGFIESVSGCICLDLDGKQVSYCDGGGMAECCVSAAPTTVFADATFDAAPCGELCITPATDYVECLPLLPDAGPIPDAGPGSCSPQCSGPAWPNVLIGVEGPDGSDASDAVAEVDVLSFDGGVLQPAYSGAPVDVGIPSNLLVNFWTFGDLLETPIVVHLKDGGEIDGTIAVGPDQECGIHEGYALFSVGPGTPSFVDSRQLSLCQ